MNDNETKAAGFPWVRSPSLLVKDLGGLALYYPGQALISKGPRRVLHPVARLGGDMVRMMAGSGEEMRAELRAMHSAELVGVTHTPT